MGLSLRLKILCEAFQDIELVNAGGARKKSKPSYEGKYVKKSVIIWYLQSYWLIRINGDFWFPVYVNSHRCILFLHIITLQLHHIFPAIGPVSSFIFISFYSHVKVSRKINQNEFYEREFQHGWDMAYDICMALR
jgi:hypothetical protein